MLIKHEKLNCFDVMANAVDILQNASNYAYFYGAKGEILTTARMRELIAAEPEYFSKYTEKRLNDIIKYSEGKVGLDCSGFISVITGINNYSTGFFEESVNKTSPESGTWGNILYTTFNGTGRHIGIDIGQGRFIHFAKECQSATMGVIRLYPWEGSGQIKGISYFLTGNK